MTNKGHTTAEEYNEPEFTDGCSVFNVWYSQQCSQFHGSAGEYSELTQDTKEEHNFVLTTKAKCMALSADALILQILLWRPF